MNAEQLKYATKGNAAAADFLRVFIAHCHMLDDVIDGDKGPVTDERLIASEIEWLLALSGNVFFQQHRALLVPLIVQAFNAWLDSNQWAKAEQHEKRIASDALKGWYHEVVFHTAFLCGGWAHMREVTSQHREYDFEKENVWRVDPVARDAVASYCEAEPKVFGGLGQPAHNHVGGSYYHTNGKGAV